MREFVQRLVSERQGVVVDEKGLSAFASRFFAHAHQQGCDADRLGVLFEKMLQKIQVALQQQGGWLVLADSVAEPSATPVPRRCEGGTLRGTALGPSLRALGREEP